ncbi:MAG: IPT/TIG domain-containing protein [Polyangiaceae bacterium]|nr:IPT/TIG domain-containing protein [Polyangiaceae bacterium]
MEGERSAPDAPVEQPDAPPGEWTAASTGELAASPGPPPPPLAPPPPPPVSVRSYPPPVVDEIAPARGSVLGDTRLTLVGSGLFRASIVRIGGVIAQTIGADEPRELRVLVPAADRPGEVDVTVENPFVPPLVLARAFLYETLAAPRIVSVAPDHVATRGGTELTLIGESFVKGTVVLFDGKPAPSPRVVSATTIDVTAPPGEDGKMVDVSVRNPDGQTATARRAFVYDRRYG